MNRQVWILGIIAAGLLAGCSTTKNKKITLTVRNHETGEPMADVRVGQYRLSGAFPAPGSRNPSFPSMTQIATAQTDKAGTVAFRGVLRENAFDVHVNARSPIRFDLNGDNVVYDRPPAPLPKNRETTLVIHYRGRDLCVNASQGYLDEQTAYIGTYTGDSGSKGIYRIRVNRPKGTVSKPELVAEIPNPSFLAFDRDREYLYAVSESSKKVFAYAGVNGDGMLTLLNEAETGAGPCHVVCHHTNLLAVADYGGGSIGAWILEGDGRIGGQAAFFQNTHASKATGRQQQPHAHGVTFSPSGNRLLVPDLGADRVYVYEQYAASSGYKPNETAPWIELPPGRGPRHVAFPQWTQSEQRDLYVLNELSNTISVFKYDYDAHQKAFTFVEEVSTLPEGFEGQSTAAELIVREKTVYATNRGHDSIARFQRDPETGRLTLLDCTPCGGKGPRHLSLMPGGLWMLVANQQSNNIALFSIGGNGALTLVPDGGVDIGAPVCVVFE